jgi:hypothetical protein
MYYVTTRDFKTFSQTRLFFDPGFNVIDATVIKSGKRYYMVFKDERQNPVQKLAGCHGRPVVSGRP